MQPAHYRGIKVGIISVRQQIFVGIFAGPPDDDDRVFLGDADLAGANGVGGTRVGGDEDYLGHFYQMRESTTKGDTLLDDRVVDREKQKTRRLWSDGWEMRRCSSSLSLSTGKMSVRIWRFLFFLQLVCPIDGRASCSFVSMTRKFSSG